MNKYVDNDIKKLNLNDTILFKLKEHGIIRIGELWNLNRTNLKDMDFSNEEINLIRIGLQLIGLDLNKRIY